MPYAITWESIKADRAERGQKSIEDIVAGRMRDAPSEQRRAKKVLAAERKLRKAVGDQFLGLYSPLQVLADERAAERERQAFEVGMHMGIGLGLRDPIIPDEIANLVQDLAAVVADHHDEADGVLALASLLRALLLGSGQGR